MTTLEMLDKLKAQTEELEKRIKALSLVTSPSAQIDQLNLTVLEIKELIDQYYTLFSEFSTNNDTNLEQLTSKIALLEENLTTLDQKHTELETNVSEENTEVHRRLNLANQDINNLSAVDESFRIRIAYTEKGILDNRDFISTNTQNITDLQTRVTTLEENQGSGTSSGTDNTELYLQLNERIEQLSLDVEALESAQSEHNSSNEEDFDAVNQKVQTLETNQETINQNINTLLANSGARTIETTHFSNSVSLTYTHTCGLDYYSPNIVVCAIPTNEITIKVKVFATTESQTNYRCNLSLITDRVIVATKYFDYQQSVEQEISYTFMPTKERYDFALRGHMGNNTTINKLEVEVTGRNPLVYLQNPINIVPFNGKYYITKSDSNGYQYLIQTPETVDLSATGTVFTPKNNSNEPGVGICVMPSGTFSGNTITYDESVLVGVSMVRYEKIGAGFMNEDNTLSLGAVKTPVVSTMHFGMSAYCDYGICYSASQAHNVGICGLYNTSFLKYENKDIPLSASACPVRNNYLLVENQPKEYYGAVVVGYDMKVYYYPEINNTTRIELEKGDHASAFYQPDKSINVYIHQFNKIIKQVLVYDEETTSYSLSDTKETIMGIEDYIEGYEGQYFVKQNGEYVVMTNNEASIATLNLDWDLMDEEYAEHKIIFEEN